MRKIARYTGLALFVMGIFVSCQKDELTAPVISAFSADRTEIAAGEAVTFTVDADADFVVIWPGDKGRNYYDQKTDAVKISQSGIDENPKFNPTSIGLMVRSEQYPYTYAKAGSYSVVLVATNIQDWTGLKIETIDSLKVVVK